MRRGVIITLATLIAAIGAVAFSTSAAVRAAAELDAPARVLDTRAGIGGPSGRVDAGEVVRLRVPGVEPGASVLLNLVAVDAGRDGYVTAWPCDRPRPATAVLNFSPGRAVANMTVVAHPREGVCFASSSSVHLVADLTGVTTDGEITGIAPRRLVDTRESRQYQAGREYRIQVAGTHGIPGHAAGAALNVTVVRPTRLGRIVVKPCGSASDAATVNYQPGEVTAHLTFAELTDGAVCITANATVDVVVDAFAWMGADSPVRMTTPSRLLDTRSGQGGTSGALRDGQVVRLRVAGESGVPNDADGATINIAVVDAAERGYVTAWPCHRNRPVAASINMWPGMRRSNQATLELSPAGELCFRVKLAGASRVHLVVDAVGYVAGEVDRDPPPVTTPPVTTPPAGDRFVTLPVGSSLPSGAACASRVRPASEIRPENSAANAHRGSRANANNRTDWSGFDRVDGAFAGTTDEIIQWAACKWGIDEDMVRAQIVKESWWYQSANGDSGESWGLGQVRVPYHQSAFEYGVNARTSSAYNLDYTYASWRACYEGVYTWLGAGYGPGDAWGCMGVWFSGRWYDQWANVYLDGGQTGGYGQVGVKQHFRDRTWEQPSFVNG